mmetsp:Transcript_21772/g.38471  ORF Transcript_21772/g.38471 Transcript_21772/m.38471 type:complete len:495 (+) Transcript_21772:172-1656(+)|eukprot:CAMPEP_0184517210 /NCGR_PEP_ID=MMETSP0198_2-20121128/5437_1 /TAXON_ID=1112570 /ORGANISM="Thraustochytrium sp., Strain LLF1b" /LENGTH=494 /DNA_ID=CAMNT_0026907575 /DNA_START=153 /DNA_END=1637 /DNA_ORIENTATION=+
MAMHSVKHDEIETRLFIDNKFVESSKTFPTVNPVSEDDIVQVHEALEEHVNAAVAAASKAFDRKGEWRTMDASARRDLILKLASLIERDEKYFVELESLDNGKPTGLAGQGYGAVVDIGLAIKCFRYYAGHADKLTGKTVPMDGQFLNMVVREPVGVVGAIIPWNFPLLMATWKLAPALACGCTVVLKTSEKTPLTALHLAKLIKEAGFPSGVVNILSGFGPTSGEPLVCHKDVDKVAFTGSTAVGRKIQELAGKHVKRVTLELGGKSPLIVCEDADLEQAVQAAHTGLFLNQGQCCIASSRVMVQDTVHDEFVKLAVKQAQSLKAGDPFHEDTTHGPQVDKLQFDRVMGYIEKGKAEGATVSTGGSRIGDKGYYIEPTVFTDVQDHHTIAQEEIFGPVMSVLKWSKLDEAIERANSSIYGLGAGVCTRDVGKAIYVAKAIRAGTVYVNCFDVFDAAAAFGGFKQSGIGRELGAAALDNYLEEKTIIIPIEYKE